MTALSQNPLTRTETSDDVAVVLAESYVVMIADLREAEAEDQIQYLGRGEIPEKYRDSPPTFRANSDRLADGRRNPTSWWLDNGTDEWFVGELSAQQQGYPDRVLMSVASLRDLIDRGWDPAWEFKGASAREFARDKPRTRAESTGRSEFVLVFTDRSAANAAREDIAASRGYVTSLDETDEGDDDQVNGRTSFIVVSYVEDAVVQLDELDVYFESIARRHLGDYDGNFIYLKE